MAVRLRLRERCTGEKRLVLSVLRAYAVVAGGRYVASFHTLFNRAIAEALEDNDAQNGENRHVYLFVRLYLLARGTCDAMSSCSLSKVILIRAQTNRDSKG